MSRRRLRVCLILLTLFSATAFAPIVAGDADAERTSREEVWKQLDRTPPGMQHREPRISPRAFRLFSLDRPALFAILNRAPRDLPPAAHTTTAAPGSGSAGVTDATDAAGVELTLPMPDGSYARFHIAESPVMAPELAAKFPGITTYVGRGLDDPLTTARFDWTSHGFHAQILSPGGAVYVDPYWNGNRDYYVSYRRRDYIKDEKLEPFRCHSRHDSGPLLRSVSGLSFSGTDLSSAGMDLSGAGAAATISPLLSGDMLQTYRLAVAATGEYTQFHSQPSPANVADGLSAVVTSVNRITGIYEIEFAVRLELVPNNDLVIYTDPNTDPYTNGDAGRMATENHNNLRRVLGGSNFDIGHVYGVGGGGLAWYGVVCSNNGKGGGASGISNPIGDPFDVSYVAHEIGHQFRADHSFNGLNCGTGQWWGPTAMEPGSGSTIMSYAGICGSDNLQSESDPLFHSINYDQILAFVTTGSGNGCAVTTVTGNNAPGVDAGFDYTIPRQTPFALTASGSDPDDDPVTYLWEERDLGPQIRLSDPDNGESPLFRVYDPTVSASRTFPKLSNLLNDISTTAERLPTLSRTMDFRVTVRDNRPLGGGVGWDEMQVTVTNAAGPFRITAPDTPLSRWGDQLVTWEVAGTDLPPVSALAVNILLSTDGGFTWPFVLAAGTPNDGSEMVLLPAVHAPAARIKIEGDGNIFFDVMNTNFTLFGPPGEVSPPGAVGPFLIAPEAAGFALTWSAPAEGGQPDRYLLYSYPSSGPPAAPTCEANLGAGISTTLPSLPDNRSFVIVARNIVGEGSYGRDSVGSERPKASGDDLCP